MDDPNIVASIALLLPLAVKERSVPLLGVQVPFTDQTGYVHPITSLGFRRS